MVRAVASTLRPGITLDAGCGTGRGAATLLDCGHQVIGVDSSSERLAQARNRLTQATFRYGELQALPVATGEVEVVVCSLALTHVPDPAPASTSSLGCCGQVATW
ncbi:class I SAM-dependent methyltransferase [Nocardia sp. NPDC050378]|uniref:class I SAM-dependent methyltransferase n=1 Tax=Nocardia sp. NPDC050378 TaxID=3155400 RepID=UPI0033D21809